MKRNNAAKTVRIYVFLNSHLLLLPYIESASNPTGNYTHFEPLSFDIYEGGYASESNSEPDIGLASVLDKAEELRNEEHADRPR